MLFKQLSLALAAAACVVAAQPAFAASYTVPTPTPSPWYQSEPIIHTPGAFSDTFSFDVAATVDALLWVFPYNPADLSALIYGTHSVSLKLFDEDNQLVATGKTAAQLGINLYADPATAAYATYLASQGFDPGRSLYWSGSLQAGSYVAQVSGMAGGALSGMLGGGGAYIIKVGVPPVPEPSAIGMGVAGMAAVGWALSRRRKVA